MEASVVVDTLTLTYDFTQPEVGGSDDTWGDKLNANWGKVDTLLTQLFPVGGSPSNIGSILQITSTSPTLRFRESDATAPAGQWQWQASGTGGVFGMYRVTATDWSTSVPFLRGEVGPDRISVDVPLTFVDIPLIETTAPTLRFHETDATEPAGRWFLQAGSSGGTFGIYKATATNWSASTPFLTCNSGPDSISFGVPVTLTGTPTVGGLGRLTLDGTSPYIWFHDSDGTVPTRNYVIAANNGTLRLSKADDAGAIVTTMMTLDDTEVSTTPNTRLAASSTSGGTVDIGHSTASQIGFQRAGSNYIKWPNAGNMTFVTDTAANAMNLTGASVVTYPDTRLAITGGVVEVGHSGAASIRPQRTGGVNTIMVPTGASLRVVDAASVAWASVSSASGWVAGASDIRLKENVRPIHYGLDTIMALRPIQFDWIAEKRHDIGFSAQDVQKLIPEIVEVWEADPDVEGQLDTLALRKDALTVVLVKAVQELTARLEILEGGS
jgi:hypothetical protein